jgi:hypothetical protein
MNPNDELTGTQVLVHPELPDDPMQQQGRLGIITFTDLSSDEIFVSFGKEQGLYSSDALLVFRKPDDIYRDLLNHTREIDTKDIKDLYRIGMLLDSGRAPDQKAAMEMAAGNPAIHSYTFMTLQEKLGLSLGTAEAQQTDLVPSRGR